MAPAAPSAHAAWVPFAGAAPGGGRVREGSPIGAKNLNLRRRTPLSPLSQNTAGSGRQGALKQHCNTIIGGRAATKAEDGGGPQMPERAVPSRSPPARCPSPEDLAADRTRVKSEVRPAAAHPRRAAVLLCSCAAARSGSHSRVQVDSALSEIHESISELAILLQKDEVSSQLVRTVPTQWQQSPASSVASDRQSLLSDCGGAQGSRPQDVHPSSAPVLGQGTVKLLAAGSDYLLVGQEEEGEQMGNLVRFQSDDLGDKVGASNGDLSYDLSMSYSVLGTSRALGRGLGADAEQLTLGADNVDLTNLSMNLSHDDGTPLTSKPVLEESGLHESQRHVMGDCSQALQQPAENISVTVSDMTGSVHDTCELSRCDASKCSPSPLRCSRNHITPKLLNTSTVQILSPAAPPKAGLGIKFKQAHRGSGFPVAAVVPGGPADCAGITPGDILMFVSCNTMTTESSSKLVAMSIAQGGASLHIILRRGSRLTAALVRRAGSGAATIGTAIAKDPSRNPHICSVASGSPAEEAGIYAGDEVVAVGSQCVAHLERQDLLELLAGEAGSLVVLGLVRPGTSCGLEWVALRRRAGVPLSVRETNAIVPKVTHSLPAYAVQQNQYVDRKDEARGLGTVEHAVNTPRDVYKLCTRAAHVLEDESRVDAPTRVPDFARHGATSKSQQGTYKYGDETGKDGSGESGRAISADPELHVATHDTQLYLSHTRSGAMPDRRAEIACAGPNPRWQQPSVLQHALVPHASLRQAVVAVGGATVSMGADLFASRRSAGDKMSPTSGETTSNPSSARGGAEASLRGAGSKTRVGLPVETMLKSSRQTVSHVSAARAAAPHPSEMVSHSGGDDVISRTSSSASGPSIGWARGERLGGTKGVQGTKGLEGEALVAAALQHIQKYESRKEKAVKTEHSRRLDTDIA